MSFRGFLGYLFFEGGGVLCFTCVSYVCGKDTYLEQHIENDPGPVMNEVFMSNFDILKRAFDAKSRNLPVWIIPGSQHSKI